MRWLIGPWRFSRVLYVVGIVIDGTAIVLLCYCFSGDVPASGAGKSMERGANRPAYRPWLSNKGRIFVALLLSTRDPMEQDLISWT